jgi:hypothetical protein
MNEKKPFKLHQHSRIDKWLEVTGPDQLALRIDFDDVDPDTVLEAAQRMVKVLNNHWEQHVGSKSHSER